MDPDTALEDLHTLMYIATTLLDGGEVGDVMGTLSSIVDTFNGLDTWLSNQGFLPRQWAKGR
jgi:hypothetical protein